MQNNQLKNKKNLNNFKIRYRIRLHRRIHGEWLRSERSRDTARHAARMQAEPVVSIRVARQVPNHRRSATSHRFPTNFDVVNARAQRPLLLQPQPLSDSYALRPCYLFQLIRHSLPAFSVPFSLKQSKQLSSIMSKTLFVCILAAAAVSSAFAGEILDLHILKTSLV